MANTRPATADPGPTPGSGSPVLEARGITKTYERGVWPRRRSLKVLRYIPQGGIVP